MADEFDPFAPGSNIKENFDGTVRCVFEKSENSDNYNAHMFITASDGEEVESFLSLGKDWVSYDGGRTVEHPRGDQTKFNGQTTYSEWITFAMGGFAGDVNDPDDKPAPLEKGLGAAGVLRERNRQLGNRGPQCADIWEGLSFHFDVLKRHGRSRVVTKTPDGERVEWKDIVQERMMPVRFLGDQGRLDLSSGGPQTGSEARNVSASAPSPAVSKDAPGTSGGGGAPGGAIHPALADLSAQDQVAIIGLAHSRDFGGFVDEVMTLSTSDGGSMLQQPKVIQALSDEGFYQTLRQG